ncbi:hypothetical protein F5Y11DRAFT_362075 [Daldinia sp. FL1419]|nr:hypothetical protein F5Y11DRAFT_362075 [Daldinia sp. FL1419]
MAHSAGLYQFHDKRGSNGKNLKFYTLWVDSEEGRVYKKLSDDADRLIFLRENAHGCWNIIRPDRPGDMFYEDFITAQRYVIEKDSYAYQGLQKLLKNGEPYPEGTEEFEAMVKYYEEHATYLETIPWWDDCSF